MSRKGIIHKEEEWRIRSLMEEKTFELGLECQVDFIDREPKDIIQRPTGIPS